ncbi:MAG: LamB/YcsF family protein [Bacteroidetes bacterium]|nr:LamB/YcsF family protein [Bacteroidota bacterium]MBS1932292.1 LamB/YcsF family protein [Bacteroidota bacterium]
MIIDLNCDMGEGIGNDEAIMPFITSVNIACGYHAGNKEIMIKTIRLALHYNVSIGAHPSFFDRENFGRIEKNLSDSEIFDLILKQLKLLDDLAGNYGTKLHHVKPHGALYNLSANNSSVAKAIASAVKNFDPHLILFGLSGSQSIHQAKKINLKTASEVFADRTYREDGSLTPRSQAGAMIENAEEAVKQALQMIQSKTVNTISGKKIPIDAETICIHGDGKHAVQFAQLIHEALKKEGIKLQSNQV